MNWISLMLRARQPCVVAGLDMARCAFQFVSPAIRLTAERPDGTVVAPGDVIAAMKGPARGLLTGEWTARVESAGRRDVTLVAQTRTRPREQVPDLTLCAALLKKPHFDLVLEKATELGVRRIQPLLTRRLRQSKAQNEATARNVLSFAAGERAKPFPTVAPVMLHGPDLAATLWPRTPQAPRPEPARPRRGIDVSGLVNRMLTAAGLRKWLSPLAGTRRHSLRRTAELPRTGFAASVLGNWAVVHFGWIVRGLPHSREVGGALHGRRPANSAERHRRRLLRRRLRLAHHPLQRRGGALLSAAGGRDARPRDVGGVSPRP